MNVQGRVTSNGLAFDGTGKFKFALISGGRFVVWTHDGTSGGPGFQPSGSIDITVTKGLYSVMLGDTTIAGMTTPLGPGIFSNPDVRLRIWFNDGTHGFQQLTPDQRVGSVGYAFVANRADQAAVLTGNVTIQQVPSILITNNATAVTLTGEFTGDGSGLTGIRGSTPFQIADAESNNALPNTGYMITNNNQRVLLLPATDTMRVGDIVRVAGPGSWKVAQRAGQSVISSHFRGGVGASWVGRDSNRNWNGIAMSTNGLNLAAVVYGRFVHLSTNGGLNWTTPPVSPSKNWTVISSSADGQRLLAGTENDFLFVSTDFGQGWSQRALPGQRTWTGVASSHDGTNLVAVPSAGNLYTSHDGGELWVARPAAGSRNWTGVASSADGTNIVAVSQNGLAWSSDKGTNWVNGTAGNFSAVACSADGQRLVVALGNAIYTSMDRGTNWLKRDAAGTKVWRSITCSADGSIIAAAAADGISISVDGGGAWTIRAGARDWRSVVCSADGLKFAAAAFGNLIYTSDAPLMRSTTIGVNGYLAGGEFSAVELQHAGNGRFSPLSSSGQIFAY